MAPIRYMLTATVLLSISYLVFRLVFMKGNGFRQQRIFLLIILAFSLLLPLSGIRIDLSVLQSKTEINATKNLQGPGGANNEEVPPTNQIEFPLSTTGIVTIYLIISVLLASALLFNFLKILRAYLMSEKKNYHSFVLLSNRDISAPFSFFRWIFIPSELSDSEETESIIIHERIHASQFHSADNLLIELTAAAMWFNPVVWMMKRSFNLIHEYLADEGTIRSGIDRFRYQAFLINNVAEEKLVGLSSNFNKSLIKKRMIMMTENTNKKQWKGRMAMLIPLSIILMSATGFINGLYPEKTEEKPDYGFYPPVIAEKPAVSSEIMNQDTIRKKVIIVSRAEDGKKPVLNKDEITVIGYGNQKNKDSVIYVVDGIHVTDISTLSPDSVETIDVMKDDNLMIIRTRKSNASKIVIRETGNKSTGISDNVLVIIDGENSSKSELENIDPSEIESIEVLKGKEISKKYIDKDHDGVIIVTRKHK
jgi:beta-lactamase regulating signal transducer with metallopeptidase domain